MSDTLLTLLCKVGRKRRTLEEVRTAFFELRPEHRANPERNAFLLAELVALAAANQIRMPAVAGSGWERIGTPPMPRWVQLVDAETFIESEDYSLVPWVPELGCWPELKATALPAAKTINSFLLKNRASLTPVPIKERSLEIFGDEKRLDALRVGDSLFGGRISLKTLGAFVVPFPLAYRGANVSGKPILVVENHNTFWSFGEWNERARRYSAVVYGSGEAFRNSEEALAQVLREVEGVGAEYFGDLDPTGLEIPLLFNEKLRQPGTAVVPAKHLYRWMVANGIRRELTASPPKSTEQMCAWLGDGLAAEILALWNDGYWMPQEALGTTQLRSLFE